MTKTPKVEAFYDDATFTLTYVVSDPETRDAVVIDPVLDYDVLASQTGTSGIQRVVDYLRSENLNLQATLETHAHADHMTAGPWLKRHCDVPVVMGAGIGQVQDTFKRVFHLPEDTPVDGSQFDILLQNDEQRRFGSLEIKTLATPGHTPACVSYLIGDAVFTGDALFMEDYGTGRTDFPAGDAKALYHSVHDVLYALPDDTRVFPGHDYQPGGRQLRYQTSIGVQKASNVQLSSDTSEGDFVEFRSGRDATLRPPRLIYQSVQVNVFGGTLPDAESNGVRYLRIPLNMRKPTDEVGDDLPKAAQ